MAEARQNEDAVYQHLGAPTAPAISMAFAPAAWDQLVQQVEDGTLAVPDPADDETAPAAPPVQPQPLYYGEGDNDYIAVTFEDGAVVVRDGNDTTGRAWQYSYEQWRGFSRAVRGEEGDATVDNEGSMTPQERAKSFSDRTAQLVQRDRQAAEEAGADQPDRVDGDQSR